MARNKALETALEEIKALREDLTGDLKKKAERLDEIISLLENIHFSVDMAVPAYDGNGNPIVKVKYSIPLVTIESDPNGEPIYPAFLVSANKLNLVSYSDMKKIAHAVSFAFSKENS